MARPSLRYIAWSSSISSVSRAPFRAASDAFSASGGHVRAEDPGSDRPTIARRGHKTLAEFSPTFPVRKYTFHTECGAVDAVDPEDMVDLAGVRDAGDTVGRAEVVDADAAEVVDVDTVKGSLGSIVVCSHIASDNTSFF